MATQTSRARPLAPSVPEEPSLPLYRLDAGRYNRMVEAGALDGIDVELVDGLLVDKHHRGEDALHRLDVETFERMVATGELEGERVELLEGLLIEVSPPSPEHSTPIVRLTRYLATARVWLHVQLPLATTRGSLPEPDLALVEDEGLPSRHPRTALLAVEVSVTSHKKDRNTKAKLYAQARVPTYWLVDVPGRVVEVRSDPGPGGYGRCEIYGIGAQVPSPTEGVPNLDVASLFEGLGD
ncbi:MAG: Uma2 family endonuclease [Solirubrobacteraceae bacterium]